jgi:hypothetical protein
VKLRDNATCAMLRLREMVRSLATRRALREAILTSLAAQVRYRDFVGPKSCERNRNAIYAVDRLSLEIGRGAGDEVNLPNGHGSARRSPIPNLRLQPGRPSIRSSILGHSRWWNMTYFVQGAGSKPAFATTPRPARAPILLYRNRVVRRKRC